MKVIVCGGLRIDYLISAAGEVRLRQMGGNAIYAAVGARHWADEVHLLARAGETYPQAWLDELNARGIRDTYVQRLPGWQEMRTFYAYVDEKTRVDHNPETHFARIGRPLPPELEGYTSSLTETRNPNHPLAIRGSDVPAAAGGADAVHIAPLALRSQGELVAEFRRQGVSQITLDPGEYRLNEESAPAIRATCAQIDAFLPSELEVGLLLGDVSARQAAETFAGWGAPLVVIKLGAGGCLLYERAARRFTEIPPYPARVADVTGAGDGFAGGFATGLQESGDPVRSALMGTVSASLTLEGYGALYALDTSPAEVRRRLDALWATMKK